MVDERKRKRLCVRCGRPLTELGISTTCWRCRMDMDPGMEYKKKTGPVAKYDPRKCLMCPKVFTPDKPNQYTCCVDCSNALYEQRRCRRDGFLGHLPGSPLAPMTKRGRKKDE